MMSSVISLRIRVLFGFQLSWSLFHHKKIQVTHNTVVVVIIVVNLVDDLLMKPYIL